MSKFRCYSCGITLNKENRSKEHIPPKILTNCLINKPTNNATVKSCKNCNTQKSDLDFRYMLGILLTLPQEKINNTEIIRRIESDGKLKKFFLERDRNPEKPSEYRLCDKQINFFTDIAKGIYYYDNKEVMPLASLCNLVFPEFYKLIQINRDEYTSCNNVNFKNIHTDILEYNITETDEQIRLIIVLCRSVVVYLAYSKLDKG
ncbi:hypothetical protein [Francisella philomiragia]|uniref:hypothetical protein n=1 Tax=Francisella philomiragia TaxID=28110 RepID=UPI00190901A4|nr:hypothetical protein [Francisella philomiragia]MBK2256157.1 hypothetical protein [Francisella philomiragia]MBK2268815.1 hypothetical protein [Francisella philomiragia]MBK2270710.1 hypothetical protein [Francisella philomiragia]MBK2274490.1 hypothetical protein [Francisella philomiragia]MBK2294084.1 hypothetical protein [Francisella philomiragia]